MRLCRHAIAARWHAVSTLALAVVISSCQSRAADGASSAKRSSAGGEVRLAEMGTDSRGIPRYTHRTFTAAERDLLRRAYGVDDPTWLYLSDSSDAAFVKLDTEAKRCRTCYVDTYRLGFLSLRQPGETWDAFETRLRAKRVRDFSPAAKIVYRSLDRLDPEARAAFTELIDAGRQAGIQLSVAETYRTPDREALLFAIGRGRTYTTTSMHTYGRAVDIVVGDGRAYRPATRREWVRFRQLVIGWPGGRFHVIGAPDFTWDWPHVELGASWLGFHSIDAALAFAARCTSDSARARPPASSELGGGAADPCVFKPRFDD